MRRNLVVGDLKSKYTRLFLLDVVGVGVVKSSRRLLIVRIVSLLFSYRHEQIPRVHEEGTPNGTCAHSYERSAARQHDRRQARMGAVAAGDVSDWAVGASTAETVH